MTDVDLRAGLEIALRVVEPQFIAIRAVDDSGFVVYDALEANGTIRTFARKFDMNDDDRIVVDAEREEVRSETAYVPAAGFSAAAHTSQEDVQRAYEEEHSSLVTELAKLLGEKDPAAAGLNK